MYVIPSFDLSLLLCGLGGLTQLLCLVAVIVIVRSLWLAIWIPLIYAVSILGPLVPLAMTFGFVRSAYGFDLPLWMLGLGAASPLALALIAINCVQNAPVVAR
jgi:hypothetical protein